MREIVLSCVSCRADLAVGDSERACQSCGRSYAVVDGIPVIIADADGAHARLQAQWFDDEVNAEWEIERPYGGPVLHRWLLAEKFRRSVANLDLRGLTALVVCGGSGMDAEFLAQSGAHVISSDISPGAGRRARERARRHEVQIDVVVADAERLPFPDRSIDVVYVHDGLHHLERPLKGLAEMARVARTAVCVTEPARAALTALAVRVGVALEHEEAGNRVARLTPHEVRSTLAARGFRIVIAERYGMYYRHEPGRIVRLLSAPGAFAVARIGFRAANRLLGPAGNKLVVMAARL
jgi:SAM-dependent methyltransferase